MSHTVITTTTTTRSPGDGCSLNTGYTGSIPGLLKIGQMVRAGPPEAARHRGAGRGSPGMSGLSTGCVRTELPGQANHRTVSRTDTAEFVKVLNN